MNKINIEMMPLRAIKPYKNNAKIHSKKEVDAMVESIRTFGWDQPIVVDKNNEIIKGHKRFLAAQKLKMTHAPVIVKSNLTEQQVIEARLADNKLVSQEYDQELIKLELDKLMESYGSIENTGFSDEEYQLMAGEIKEQIEDIDLDKIDDAEQDNPFDYMQDNFSSHQLVVSCINKQHKLSVISLLKENNIEYREVNLK